MVGGPHHYNHSYPRGSQPSIRHVCGLLQMGHEPSAPTTNHVGTPTPAVGVWIRLLPPWVLPQKVSVQGKVVLDYLCPSLLLESAEPVSPLFLMCGGVDEEEAAMGRLDHPETILPLGLLRGRDTTGHSSS